MGTLKHDATSLNGMEASSAKLYKVVLSYNVDSGFVETITVTDS